MIRTPRFIGPWRRRAQWLCTLLYLLLPWIEVNGRSLLRVDIPGLRLYLFGQVLRIEELYLVLLAVLVFILGFLLVTVVLGRVWCGWLCPQTTLSDLAEWTARRCGFTVRHNRLRGSLWRNVLLQGAYMAFALLMASALLWYFIPPRIFFSRLFTLDLHYAAWTTFALTALLVYLDLALVRRLLCRELCPYGRIQTALVSPVTLTLHLPPGEMEHCIDCGGCVRACPMDIDIRQGFQVECISCARCLDACRAVMAGRGRPGLIRYTFGLQGKGARVLLDPRILLPGAVLLILVTVFAFLLGNRPAASIKVAVSHTVAQRMLGNGQVGTFFNAWIRNRGQQEAAYTVLARNATTGSLLPLKGQVHVRLAPGRNQRLDFVLVTPADRSPTIRFVLQDSSGQELATAEARLPVPARAGP